MFAVSVGWFILEVQGFVIVVFFILTTEKTGHSYAYKNVKPCPNAATLLTSTFPCGNELHRLIAK